MALIQMNLMSKSLLRTVPVSVILPVDKMLFPGDKAREDKPFKTLYLLHGVFGSYMDWVSGTRVQRYANEHDLAVVMPSGDNAFYVDRADGHNYYGEFVGQELVELTRKIFPLSHRREDTFLGGLSMGGYGALRNGLKYGDTFGAIVALSSTMIVDDIESRPEEGSFIPGTRRFGEACFGDLSKVRGSDLDPYYLIQKRKELGLAIPDIYMACGTEDSLLPENRRFRDYLREQNVGLTYEESPGGHSWDFWDFHIRKAIQWLPTEGKRLGMDSGNVGI